ncbi:unnamed protein product [Boreogadus saida]
MTALEKLDQVANDILSAAQIDADALHTLSREDLRDLFPGPEHFLRRKSIWKVVHPVEQASSSSCAADTQHPNTQTPNKRKYQHQRGKSSQNNTIAGLPFKLFKRLIKRMQNIRTPRKSQGATPARGKKRRLEFGATEGEDEDDFDSSASTVISSPSCSSPISSQEGDPQVITSTPVKQADVLVECRQDSRMAQARHYTTLQKLYRKTKQNRDDVAQLLDLEFEGRRAFIDSDTMREQDRLAKILEAYPCLRDIDHVLDELGRILNNNNSNYVEELRERWLEFKSRVSFYGVYKKAMKPPMSLSAEEQAINLLTVLPALFPSNVAVPKKMTSASEALIHVLLPTEDPETFLNRRPLATPLVLVDKNQDAFLCLGTEAIPLPKRYLGDAGLYIIAYYYALHMTYPKCVACVLSIIQTEVLGDSIHEKDATPAFKRARTDWKAFLA